MNSSVQHTDNPLSFSHGAGPEKPPDLWVEGGQGQQVSSGTPQYDVDGGG